MSLRSPGRTRRSRRWRRGGAAPSRGVAEVIGTILILALTVVLFSAIFFFVNTFPRPPSQPSSQFAASLTYGPPSNTTITSIRILHLGGPVVFSGGTAIYLFSQSPYKALCPVSGCTLPSGLPAPGLVWTLGETWNQTLTGFGLLVPVNVTVSIVSNSQLLFSQNVPGSAVNSPPIFLRVWATIASPVHNTSFNVSVKISDSNLLTTCKSCVSVIATALPGHNTTGILPMIFAKATSTWSVKVPTGTAPWSDNKGGVYTLFVVATNSLGLQNTVAITITVT